MGKYFMDEHSEEEGQYLDGVYKKRGFQQQKFGEYLLLKRQQSGRKRFRLPGIVKIILSTPFILMFCLGLVFIPYLVYLFLTSK